MQKNTNPHKWVLLRSDVIRMEIALAAEFIRFDKRNNPLAVAFF
jgi:hypothetical protein